MATLLCAALSRLGCFWRRQEDGVPDPEAYHAAEGVAAQEKVLNAEVKGKGEQWGKEDLLKYRPNPDMMDSKFAPDGQDNDGLYRPLKFVPASMDDKHQKDASRRERALARMATENPYLKEMIDDAADRPKEWKETVGDESKEFVNYMGQREKQEKHEEELFTRALVTKREKYMEKQMKKQLHGNVLCISEFMQLILCYCSLPL